MKLSEATQLLSADNARAFAEVYKIFEYKDDGLLKDYLEFVVHEPAEWMRGFPVKWKSESQFSRVRAAFHKLLKRGDVEAALGATYATEIHDAVWSAFKEHMATVVAERNRTGAAEVVPKPINELLLDVESVRSDKEELSPLAIHDEDVESVHSVKKGRRQTLAPSADWETRYRLMERAFRILVGGDGDETTRLRQALLVMMDGAQSANFGRDTSDR